MRERLCREYFRRVKMAFMAVLAINRLALPVLTYSFGVIYWETTDQQQLDRQTRKFLTMHGVHHPSADVDRLYAPCNEGGLGLKQIEAMYKSCIVGLQCYLRDSSDRTCRLHMSLRDSGTFRYSIKPMARRLTAELRRKLAENDTLQSLESKTKASLWKRARPMERKQPVKSNATVPALRLAPADCNDTMLTRKHQEKLLQEARDEENKYWKTKESLEAKLQHPEAQLSPEEKKEVKRQLANAKHEYDRVWKEKTDILIEIVDTFTEVDKQLNGLTSLINQFRQAQDGN